MNVLATSGTAVLAGVFLAMAGCGTKRVDVVVTPEMKQVAGVWSFNPAESDDSATAAERIRETMRRGRPGGGPPGGARGGFPPSGGAGGPGMRPPPGEMGAPPGGAPPGSIGNLLRAPPRLTIGIADSTVKLDEDGGGTRSLSLDARWVKESVGPDLEVKTRAFWEGRFLVVEREMARGMKVREEYFVEQTEHRLHVVVQLAPPQGEKVRLLRVYDPE